MTDNVQNVYVRMGNRVAKRRLELGWSQENLAYRLRLSRASVANIETGRQRILIHTGREIARVLRIDWKGLMQ